jgi:hypothetical protein
MTAQSLVNLINDAFDARDTINPRDEWRGTKRC